MIKISLLLLVAFAALVLARCNNNCNGHGNCVSNNCACNPDWAGEDCSISVRTLTSGVPIVSGVEMWEWEYFKIDIKQNSNFVVEMTQADTHNSDCDIYARVNNYPTHLQWQWRDISLASYVRHEFDAPPSGTWYFGVVGFLSCNYTIKVTVLGQCLEGCNGNGDCIEGACFCNAGWSGDACQHPDVPLTLGQWTTGSVQHMKMAIYHVRLNQPAVELTWEVEQTQTVRGYDVDLYVRHESAPTTVHWDYANGTTAPNTVLKIADAAAGFWYAGIYGFECPASSKCDFRIRVSSTGAADSCADSCSLHGTCNHGLCNCYTGYTGEYCEQKTAPLNLNEVVGGLVGDQTWNYYSFVSNSMNPVVVSVKHDSSGDCDLYIRSDANPTRFNYEFFDIGLETSFNITIPQPGQTNWKIGVFGFTRCQYNLTVTGTLPGSNCLHGGSRPAPTLPCICPAGWSGQQCEIQVIELRSDTKIEGTVAVNEWKYYNFTINFYSTNIFIQARELDEESRGEVWLFASSNVAPTIRDHDFSNTDLRHLHTVSIQRPSLPNPPPNYRSSVIIGVYGSPFITKPSSRYALVAWASPF